MRTLDLFHLSSENLKTRKSRFLFTILGVSVGIGAILFLVSLGFGLQKILLEQITTKESLLTLDIVSPDREIIRLTPRILEDIEKINQVEKVSPQAIFPGQVSSEGLTSETTLNLVSSDFFSLSGILPRIGTTFTEEDKQKILVNSSAAELFNLTPDQILNKEVTVSILFPSEFEETAGVKIVKIEKKLEVIGVIEEPAGSPSSIYLKVDSVPEISINEYQSAKVKVVSNEVMEGVRKELIEMGFMVSSLSDTIEQANQIFRVIQIILGIFGVIALIVAGIGLVNTMTISLLERINEIGIMRAIGASSQDVKKLFLGESVMTGFLGGVGGIAIGMVFSELFNRTINILAERLGGQPVDVFFTPIWFIIFIIALSAIVGLIGGFWPANQAAKFDPLKALRHK
jgi:putative ABC transport system permease protein